MRPLKEMEIGVMFWAGREPKEIVRELRTLGVACGQLGIPGNYGLPGASESWKKALKEEDFVVYTVFAGFQGENYADIPTVQETVGYVPPGTREEREARTLELSDFAADLGVPSIALHVGFVPEDRSDPDYAAVRDIVGRVAAHAAKNNQTLALETGQEPAPVLLDFIRDVGRENVGINFDPANLILYGVSDPIEALDVLGHRILTVHCKDGDWPPKDQPEALGIERPLGQGAVGMDRFIGKLKEIGYTGPLAIEREIEDQEQRLKDIRAAVRLLETLRSA
jgi:sugar phosphate isomerase/epimerase